MNKLSKASVNLQNLRDELRRRSKESGKTYAEIGRLAGVATSQVSRICRSDPNDRYAFKTLSANVVQVCKALQIPVETVVLEQPVADAAQRRLQESLKKVWDQTPEDAERIASFLEQLADLRHASRS